MTHGAAVEKGWLAAYQRGDLAGDLTAGTIVAIMLVPQGMAYAMLASLPPQVGLYASLIPLVLYALLGTSRSLAVGPVAIVSLLTASAIGAAAHTGVPATELALTLALLSGVMLFAMGLLRFGFLVNFLSHSVISGFTSAAALIIGFSQLKHLLGIDLPRTHLVHETILYAVERWPAYNWTTVALSCGTVGILLLVQGPFARLLVLWGVRDSIARPLTKTGPLMAAIAGTVIVWLFGLDQQAGVKIVGAIPSGLPAISVPDFQQDVWLELAPAAFLISIVGFMESVSVAKALASRRRQKIDPNRELLALGAANVGAAVGGGYPVTGGFSRSVVNFSAGANTPLASLVTAALVLLTVLFLMPLFYYLPRAVLSAIIVVAVANLIDIQTLRRAWLYDKADAVALLVTVVAVLSLGIEVGILVGVAVAVAIHLYRTSRPHIAVVGRKDGTEHFRNVERHQVETVPTILAIRVDESLYFANTRYLEEQVMIRVADAPEIRNLVLICSAINEIDASALETLERLIEDLAEGGVIVHLAEVKGPVMDRLNHVGFAESLAPGQIFLSTHAAFVALAPRSEPA